MPEPLSSNNSSVYDRSTQLSPLDGCDPTTSSCAALPPVEIEPVRIEGDAGKQALLERLESNRCGTEKAGAALAGLALGVAVVQLNPPGAFVSSLGVAKELSALSHCHQAGAERTAVVARCEARGGVAAQGVNDNEVICFVNSP
jgi:hypothetical protein